MEFWTRKNDQLAWRQWPDVALGLEGLRQERPASLLLVTARPMEELGSLLATVGLARRLAEGPLSVIVASHRPSDAWIAPLREAGVEHVWVLGRPVHPGETGPEQARPTEAPSRACPALHARTGELVSLSVCGCHRDLMVLAPHHLKAWCLGHNDDCPHWRGEW